jgi:hypothetical protein
MRARHTVRIYHLEEQHFKTLREAADFYDRWQRLGHVMPFAHQPIDAGDDGLTDAVGDVLSMPDSPARDVLIALIDGAAAAA